MKREIKNGDVFDIGQTVNGVSRFLWWDRKWYYFEDRFANEYEYDHEALTKLVTDNEYNEVALLGNILSTFKSK